MCVRLNYAPHSWDSVTGGCQSIWTLGNPNCKPQSFVTATQSTSTSKGPVHSGTQKKMRAGGFFGK